MRSSRSIHSSVVNSVRSLPVFLEVEGGELDGRELVDPEGVLSLRLPRRTQSHLDLRPDAAGEQALEVADVVIGDVDVAMPEVGALRPSTCESTRRTFTLSMKVCCPAP